jgi:3-hydroxyacyl-CoA dehydrogenase/enoyl-CoA hydratase/3-hydroxybutyryl-CoA epimerase
MTEVSYVVDSQDQIGEITIHTAGPVNTIGPVFLSDLESTISRAGQDGIHGLVIRSSKKRSFLDGANLRDMLNAGQPYEIREAVQQFQHALDSLATAPFPVVAVLDGQTALGGGFELLLWSCDHVFSTASSRFGLPEITLGLFPAGGGTQTLRKVVGFAKSLDMILRGNTSLAEAYAGSGFLTVCGRDELDHLARKWLKDHPRIVNRNYDESYPEPWPITETEKINLLKQARRRYTICRHRPNFGAALDAIEAGLKLPFRQAVQREVELFVPLPLQDTVKNKMDLFFLTTSVGPNLVKVDSEQVLPINSIAVIGAGLMGTGIAQVAAQKNVLITLMDLDEHKVQAALAKLDHTLTQLVSQGKWTQDRKDSVLRNVTWTNDYKDLSQTPLVIESVFEDLSVKREVLDKVQRVNPRAIFASNTSTLPMAEIGDSARNPEQVVGMHFFSPVPLMPLLEVVQGPLSSQSAVATAVTMGRTLGKTVILVQDGPGFYTSRTFASYVMNGFRLAERGISPWQIDALAVQEGFPQGPLHVYGTTGGNVIYHAGLLLTERFKDRLAMPNTLARLYENGYVGVGRPCFYSDSRKMIPDETALQHVERVHGVPIPSDEECRDILLLGMVNEAFWCMSDGVLGDYYSMDLGAVLGIGFPDCFHGPARYVTQRGIGKVRDRLSELCERFSMASLQPAPEFDQLISDGVKRLL